MVFVHLSIISAWYWHNYLNIDLVLILSRKYEAVQSFWTFRFFTLRSNTTPVNNQPSFDCCQSLETNEELISQSFIWKRILLRPSMIFIKTTTIWMFSLWSQVTLRILDASNWGLYTRNSWKIHTIVLADPNLKVREMMENIGRPRGSLISILNVHLRRPSARWVQGLLTIDHKNNPTTTLKEGLAFLRLKMRTSVWIVMYSCTEHWFTPETKQQSK